MSKLSNYYYSFLTWLVINDIALADARSVSVINKPGEDNSEKLTTLDTLIKSGQNFLFYAVAPATGGWLIYKGMKRLSSAERDEEKESAQRQIVIGACMAGIVPIIQALYDMITSTSPGS